jgi:hypothetical protein
MSMGILFLMGLMFCIFFFITLGQRDDADETLKWVRFYTYAPSYRYKGLTDEQRVKLIKEALEEGKR